MAENASPEEGASLQRHGLQPGTPQPQKLEPSEPPDGESPRVRRRRQWHTGKIDERRAKQRLNRSTNSVASSSLTDDCSMVAEIPDAALSAYLDHAASLDDNRSHNRTPSQWKTILELQLCAACLTRTIPPHKPKDERAPCKDLPSVPYDDVYIAAIRQGLAREEPPVRRKGNGNRMAPHSGGRKQQSPAAHVPRHGDKHTPQRSLDPNVQYSHASIIQHTEPQSYGLDVHSKSSHAPLYNFRGSSSYHPYHTVPSRHTARPGTGSQSSITLEHPEVAELVPEGPQYSEVLKPINTHPKTPPRQSVEDIDVLGMTPATPLIPEIHVEGVTELAGVELHHVGLLPESDMSALMPPTSNVDRDWDSVTNVAEVPEQTKLEDPVDGDLSSSKVLVEKLLGDATKAIVLSVDRSWTLKGLCPSPNSSEWDDATMVEEPQELSPDFGSFSDKVYKSPRSAQSAESFFATRQGTFWV